jgi:ABC-2 type transport system ATP-binding protein
MGSALEVTAVDYSFRVGFWLKRTQVLNAISLDVPEKTVFGFLGSNGAGKTTLIHLITGIRTPMSGQVKIFGHEAHTPSAKSKIGYLPERPYFHEHLTGEGLLKYYGTLSGMSPSKLGSRIPKVLAQVGLSDAKKLELKRYSKGMLQRIGIAQSLIHDPEILVLDEPMSGLDPIGRKEVRELIVNLAGEGRTVFFSSHIIPDVEAICDQVAFIQKGKLMGCGPIGSFLAQGPLRTEIGFSGKRLEDWAKFPEFLSTTKIQDGLRGLVEGQQDVEKVLNRLLRDRAKIIWVKPIRPSLEALLSDSSLNSAKNSKKEG